jgi:hypothetical protein
MRYYNFNCCFVWVRNLVPHIKRRTMIEGFENRVMRRIFQPVRDEVTGGWRNCIMRSCIICFPHRIILRWSNEGRQGWWSMKHAWGMRKAYRHNFRGKSEEWGYCSEGSIFTLQKKMIRIMAGTKPRNSCRSLFRKLEILPLCCEYVFSLMNFIVNNLEHFQTNSTIQC